MANLSLFDISVEFYALADLIEHDEIDQETGEFIDNSEQIEALYNDLKLSFEEKLENSQRYLLTLKSEEDILATEIKRLQAKKTALINKQDRLKKLMLSALKTSGSNKFKTPLYSFSIRKAQSVNIIDESLLERKYLRVKYEPNKTAIKEAIKDGEDLKGASIVEKDSLTIK